MFVSVGVGVVARNRHLIRALATFAAIAKPRDFMIGEIVLGLLCVAMRLNFGSRVKNQVQAKMLCAIFLAVAAQRVRCDKFQSARVRVGVRVHAFGRCECG